MLELEYKPRLAWPKARAGKWQDTKKEGEGKGRSYEVRDQGIHLAYT